METIFIDETLMSTREAIHDYLSACLDLPDWYGRNLDALYDLLTERGGPIRLSVRHRETVAAALNGYGAALLRMLEEAAAENPAIELVFEAD